MRERLKRLILPAAATCLIAFAAFTASAFAQTSTSATSSQTTTEYHNEKYGFSLSYPADLKLLDEGDPTRTYQSISFVNASTTKELDIAIIPYAQVDMTADTLQPLSPDGMTDQGNTLTDVTYVDQYFPQFWFVKNGVMYDVGAPNGDEAWLFNLLNTWHFN